MVNHEPKQWEWCGKQYNAQPGQVITSIDTIKKKAGKGITTSIVRKSLDRFVKLQFLSNESSTDGRLITVINWDSYQSANNRQSIGQSKGRAKVEQGESKGRASNNNDKEFKNDKNDKEEKLLSEFEKFWEMYEKKNDRKKAFQKWKKLKQEDKDKIFETLPEYVKSTPDKKYRKNPVTYLNNESWKDEIVYRENKNKQPNKTNIFDCL
jgi:hypothetical protein